jgi:hypothetical protein
VPRSSLGAFGAAGEPAVTDVISSMSTKPPPPLSVTEFAPALSQTFVLVCVQAPIDQSALVSPPCVLRNTIVVVPLGPVSSRVDVSRAVW